MSGGAGSRAWQLEQAVRAFRGFQEDSVVWDDWVELREVGGTLESTAENLELASTLQGLNLLDTDVDLETATASPGRAIQVTLTLTTLRSQKACFARDLASMLAENVRFRFEGPQAFFVAEPAADAGGGYLHPGELDAAPSPVSHYLQTLRLIGLLEAVSDYVEQPVDARKLFFKLRRTLSLPVVYGADDLVALEDPATPGRLDKIDRLLQAKYHQDQIRDILKAALIETLIGTEERFVDVLSRFERLFRRFEDNYQLFISEFSFEKIREQAEEHRLEYTDKLNAVFAGIQSKLLGIPIALVIVAGEMKNEEGATLHNFMILLGALVFAGLMLLLIANQRDTLKVLQQEIQRQGAKIALHQDIRDKLQDVYSDLDRRYLHHRRLLRWVELLVVLSVLLPIAVFLFFARAW